MAEEESSGEVARSDVAVILDNTIVQMPFMAGQLPGSEPDEEDDDLGLLGMNLVKPPVEPERLIKVVASDGELAAVMHAVAEGAAGSGYKIVPRFSSGESGIDLKKPSSWPEEVMREYERLHVFVNAGFVGRGAESLRSGFRDQEHDRAVLGWGGVVVMRESVPDKKNEVPRPKFLGRFEASVAKFTRPEKKAVLTPVPIVTPNGKILWIEEPRHFRRLVIHGQGIGTVYFKEYGDWRAMDSRTGKYAKNWKHVRPTAPFTRGLYDPGTLPANAVPALEVAHWETPFPGAYPYGVSAWHSELAAADSAYESIKLVRDFLKSGLHSVIIAAANRPFEGGAASAALDKINKLGRGREGLGALIQISLVPTDSKVTNPLSPQGSTSDSGRVILHELNTKLQPEIMNGQLRESMGRRFAHAERIPAILLGKSDQYNFATASAAWSVVNRMRFAPHHDERQAFLDRLLVEMGVTHWRIEVQSAEWDEDEPLASVVSTTGQLGGVSVNMAMDILGTSLEMETKRIETWWGDLPMSLVHNVLSSPDPAGVLRMLGFNDAAEQVEKQNESQVSKPVLDMLTDLEKRLADRIGGNQPSE